ncbi:MAG: DUF362 domain-containing protein [Dehalococcoidia bacterium]|nr:DUF362 domain-containing protein [Dehalococcoidia bacterium]MDW8120197.1 DUF362 domain-containing protein [Chloroflexota bacterium]
MTLSAPAVLSTSQAPSARPKVAVVFTRPETVLEDVGRAMHLADYRQALPAGVPVLLKINISWQHWYPACSTTPWQLEGVICTLLADGYRDLIPAQNGTVVVDSFVGEVRNGHKGVLDAYGLKSVHLDVPPQRWIPYTPKRKLLVLDKIFPEGLTIPDIFPGKSIIHLPTVKTHVFTTITGAMKNAFGGLLNRKRHWTHSVIHETLVDLLVIQKEIHAGLFAVMDGTFAGDGPGPRAMRWHVKNVLLASADQVAIDAVAARLMGFDPLSITFIRLAHEAGLGVGDPRQIEVVGADISGVNFRFRATEETFASRGQKLIYWGPLKPLEHWLLRTPIVPWAYFASNAYYNGFWRTFIGRRRVQKALRTPWGQLFQRYVREGALRGPQAP